MVLMASVEEMKIEFGIVIRKPGRKNPLDEVVVNDRIYKNVI
jgi:hypothetical protein